MELYVAIVDDTDADRKRIASDVHSALATAGIPCTISTYASAESYLTTPPHRKLTLHSLMSTWMV